MGEAKPASQESGRRVRVFLFLPWAEGAEDALAYVARLPAVDIAKRVTDPSDERLKRMARLDLDWHGETARCLAQLSGPPVEFLPTQVVGPTGLAPFLGLCGSKPAGEAWWLVFMAQHPQRLGATTGRFCAALKSRDIGLLYYAFDEASRTMPCFGDIAPHLDVLIHDEMPLGGASRLRAGCRAVHRSWVANVVPFATPFVEEPEERIVFLGSEMGLTPHRRRQIEFLKERFGAQFTAIHDHSLAVADRSMLGRFKVSLCPEGRKFATPAMATSHTDRPFWSGCMGMVPVSENSRQGNRLDGLAAQGLIVRYAHGDLNDMAKACESALAVGRDQRLRIYEHFNRNETVGRVVADALSAALRSP